MISREQALKKVHNARYFSTESVLRDVKPITDPESRGKLIEWVEALRSDKYRQTKRGLYDVATGGFCCLGVYASAVDHTPLHKIRGGYLGGTTKSDFEERFARNNPATIQNAFAELNDSGSFTFNDIADIIEAIFLAPVNDEAAKPEEVPA